MSLNTRLPLPSTLPTKGYKGIVRESGIIRTPVIRLELRLGWNMSPIGIPLTAPYAIDQNGQGWRNVTYTSGFHCFLNREDAVAQLPDLEIIEVELADIVAAGEQYGYPMIVAMRIRLEDTI